MGQLIYYLCVLKCNEYTFKGDDSVNIALPYSEKHYENMPIKIYTENFTTKNENFQIKIRIFFSHFCSKHRLWVLVRTASPRRFGEAVLTSITIYVFEQK